MISPDSPITKQKDDKLGRASFAKALAKAVLDFDGEDSFVVGIHGKWGTGKSSVLNLLVEELAVLSAARVQSVDVLPFNPWNFSDQNQLVLQFLRQFTAHLRKLESSGTAGLKTLLENLDQYATALAPPLDAIPVLKHLNLFAAGIRIATKTIAGGKDVDSLFATVSRQLRDMKRKTVVIIDDIDRLTAAEIRQVFQLVKLSARFPYVVYVLAFDRDAVANALSGLGVTSGEEYLEKIVQVSFDLPPISEQTMTLMISEAIEKIVATYPSAHFDNHRYNNLFHSGLRRSLSSLRDLRRFINGLEFGFGMIAKEVNGVDFIGVEALRVFYPKVFDAIRRNKEIVAGHIDVFERDKGADTFRARVDEMFTSAGADIEACKSVVVELFPKLQYAYSKTLHGADFESQWEKALRVCTTRYFDFYFQLVVPEGEVSAAEIDKTLESTDNQNELVPNLVRYVETNRLRPALETFRTRLKSLHAQRLANVLGALLEIGDRAKHSGSMIAGQMPEVLYVSWAIFDVIDLLPRQDRVATLEDRFRATDGVGTAADLIVTIKAINEKEGQKYGEFDDQALSRLQSVVVDRIRLLSETGGSLLHKDFLPKILFSWKTWGDATEAATYIANITSSPKDFIVFLDKFIYQTTSVGGGEKAARINNKLNIRAIAEVTDIGAIIKRIESVDDQTLSADEKAIVDIARESVRKFQKSGLPPEKFGQGPDLND
jgi:predicted KAP-like P-loop ATPase